MKTKRFPLKDFDFEGFESAIVRFLGRRVDKDISPYYPIVKVAEPGAGPQCRFEEGNPDLMSELEAGGSLFFPFSDSNVGEPIGCADGKGYKLEEGGDFFLGDIDCAGYLIQLQGDYLIISSAVHAGGGCPPSPSVDMASCGELDSPMEEFIDRFIRR